MKYLQILLAIVIIGTLTACGDTPDVDDTPQDAPDDTTGITGQVINQQHTESNGIEDLFAEDTGRISPPPIPTT